MTTSARVAQLVERQAFNLNVQGSSPCSGEYVFVLCIYLVEYGHPYMCSIDFLQADSFSVNLSIFIPSI